MNTPSKEQTAIAAKTSTDRPELKAQVCKLTYEYREFKKIPICQAGDHAMIMLAFVETKRSVSSSNEKKKEATEAP